MEITVEIKKDDLLRFKSKGAKLEQHIADVVGITKIEVSL